MKIRHGWCIFYLFVGFYVLICINLQLALWREESHDADGVCTYRDLEFVYCVSTVLGSDRRSEFNRRQN